LSRENKIAKLSFAQFMRLPAANLRTDARKDAEPGENKC
jgi:hypothetical protein